LKYFLYVLQSVPAGKHYFGIAGDVDKRLHEHNTKNGRWTTAYKPWRLVGVEEYPDRASANRRERFLKSREGIAARRQLVEALAKEEFDRQLRTR
jgi:putative endonuclease